MDDKEGKLGISANISAFLSVVITDRDVVHARALRPTSNLPVILIHWMSDTAKDFHSHSHRKKMPFTQKLLLFEHIFKIFLYRFLSLAAPTTFASARC